MSESPAYQVVRGIVSAVVKDTESPAGGTVSLANLPLPTTGYFVGGAVPELVFESFVTVNGPKIVEFVESAPSRYVEWWVDTETGRVHVDAVNWYQEEFAAGAIARARGELAVWDIARNRELRLAYVDGERA